MQGKSRVLLLIALAVVLHTAINCSKSTNSEEEIPPGKIAFVWRNPVPEEIVLIRPDGSGRDSVLNIGCQIHNPKLSPDGKKIAFSAIPAGKTDDIYVANVYGPDTVNLTQHGGFDSHPTWSPDGSKLAFVSSRDGDYFGLYIMDGNGSNISKVTYGLDCSHPAWSPDGGQIAFSVDDGADIYVIDVEGKNLQNITGGAGGDTPVWSPDGSKISFSTNRDGNSEIYVAHADGTQPVNLTQNPATDVYPAWSPDGSAIAFTSYRDGNAEIYIMNADGTNPRNITQTSSGEVEPSWSP